MKHIKIVLTSAVLAATAVFGVSRTAAADFSDCGSIGTLYSGVCWEGYATGRVFDAYSSGDHAIYASNDNVDAVIYAYSITSGGTAIRGDMNPTAEGSAIWGENNTTTAGAYAGYFHGTVDVTAGLYVAGTCVDGTCSSDARLKKNIQPLAGALDTISRLKPVTFEWIDPKRGEGVKTGFIAQDVEQVRPDWVTLDDQGYRQINMDRLPVFLVDSVRTLKAQNDALQERVKVLEGGQRLKLSGFDGLGLGAAGLAVAGAVLIKRRRREQTPAS